MALRDLNIVVSDIVPDDKIWFVKGKDVVDLLQLEIRRAHDLAIKRARAECLEYICKIFGIDTNKGVCHEKKDVSVLGEEE